MIVAVIRLMRPADWVKNLFVLPALVFGHRRHDPESIGVVGLAFLAFCLIASATYAINDVIDVEKDRAHPVKRRRPVASGAIGAGRALAVGAVLAIAALIVGFSVNGALGTTIVIYAGLQVAYNLGLKRVIFVDVVVIALGFSLRAAAGALALEVPISAWLLLCVFFLCLYLGFIKRLCDLASAEAQDDSAWRSPAGYDSRGELNWLLGVSAVLAVVTYLMYAMSDHAEDLFGPRSVGFALLSPIVLIAVHRFYRRASLGRSDSPFAALRGDPVVLVAILVYAGAVVTLIYVPALDGFFRGLLAARGAGP